MTPHQTQRFARRDQRGATAQRFARLLVDEIKLYNQAKVTEGRKYKDLYDRLREDIEKSRSTYQKRYGNTPAASGDYFNTELVRSLAEDEEHLLTFYAFPQIMHRHIQTTNAIESLFSNVRQRTDQIDVFTTETSCLAIVWATIQDIRLHKLSV